MAEYNIGDKFVVEIINKSDEPLAPYISGEIKSVTVYYLKGIPFMLDADTLSNFEKYEERKKGKWIAIESNLPQEGKDCLVYDGRYILVWMLTKNCETGDLVFEDDYGYYHNIDEITHWMPLPEPPMEE